jgi:hypothetical protein
MTWNRLIVPLVVSLALGISSLSQAQQLRIYHIDVNQADATLFVSPGGHTLLVDSDERMIWRQVESRGSGPQGWLDDDPRPRTRCR